MPRALSLSLSLSLSLCLALFVDLSQTLLFHSFRSRVVAEGPQPQQTKTVVAVLQLHPSHLPNLLARATAIVSRSSLQLPQYAEVPRQWKNTSTAPPPYMTATYSLAHSARTRVLVI